MEKEGWESDQRTGTAVFNLQRRNRRGDHAFSHRNRLDDHGFGHQNEVPYLRPHMQCATTMATSSLPPAERPDSPAAASSQ
jgi:hypothetical protein